MARQDVKEIAAIRSWRPDFAFRVALSDGGSDQWPDRALQLTVRDSPIKAIVLPFITIDLLGVVIVLHRVVFLLRSHKFLADTDCRVLVAAYSAEQDLSLPRFGVEKPQIPFFCQRYRCGPVFCPDVQSDGAIRFFEEAVHLLVLAHEVRVALGVLDSVTRRHDLPGVRSENLERRFFIVVL